MISIFIKTFPRPLPEWRGVECFLGGIFYLLVMFVLYDRGNHSLPYREG
jgi:hypothetical protein